MDHLYLWNDGLINSVVCQTQDKMQQGIQIVFLIPYIKNPFPCQNSYAKHHVFSPLHRSLIIFLFLVRKTTLFLFWPRSSHKLTSFDIYCKKTDGIKCSTQRNTLKVQGVQLFQYTRNYFERFYNYCRNIF